MTAKQKAARAKFKAVVKEAGKLRKKNPGLTQAQAVKQAWAISYSKQRAGKKLGATKKAKQTKVKAKKSKTTEQHTDTKSHNVNIRVVSGIEGRIYQVRDLIEKDIKYYLEGIERLKKDIPKMTKFEQVRAKESIKTFKKIIVPKLKKQLREQNSLIKSSLK